MYEHHVGAVPGRRDLRFKPQIEGDLDEIRHFAQMPLGDVWEEAELLGPLLYLFYSKRLRLG